MSKGTAAECPAVRRWGYEHCDAPFCECSRILEREAEQRAAHHRSRAMSGLRRIARMYGGMVINGTRYVWDYATEEPVREADMPLGSERWKASEAARYSLQGGAEQWMSLNSACEQNFS